MRTEEDFNKLPLQKHLNELIDLIVYEIVEVKEVNNCERGFRNRIKELEEKAWKYDQLNK